MNVKRATEIFDSLGVIGVSYKGEPIVEIVMNQDFQMQSNIVNNIQYDYLVQQIPGANISLDLNLRNLPAGIWKINLYGEYIFNGSYDISIFQKKLLKPNTRLITPDPYTTLSTPCSASSILVNSYYDNVRNIIAPKSGRGYPRTGAIKPTVTCEGFDLLTTGVDNSLVNSSGAAMAGAILTGAIALIYQWGLVQGNNPRLYPVQLRNILIASTVKQEDIIYPNEEWGFGKLSFEKLSTVLKTLSRNNNDPAQETNYNDNTKELLYVNIPSEMYYRLK